MPFERCMGLDVADEGLYQQYRDGMTPILGSYQGRFRYDFKIAQTLKSEEGASINRVFIIAFPDQASHDAFFADPAYLQVRERYFKPSVKQATLLLKAGG